MSQSLEDCVLKWELIPLPKLGLGKLMCQMELSYPDMMLVGLIGGYVLLEDDDVRIWNFSGVE